MKWKKIFILFGRNNMKDITVFIPLYNAESTIIKTLESLEKQDTDEIDRIIIIDDWSTDQSKRLIHEFAKKSKFFIEIRENKKPSWLAYKYNQILNEIKTKYLILMHADIVIEEKNAITIYRNETFKNPNTYAVCGLEKMNVESWDKYNFRLKLERAPFVYDTITKGWYHCCAWKFDMLDVEKVKEIGWFDSKKYFMAWEDWDLYLRITETWWKINRTYVGYNHLHNFDINYSLENFLKRKFRYRQATGVLFRNHFTVYRKSLSLYIRLFITIVMIAWIIVAFSYWDYSILLLSVLLILWYTFHYCRLFLNKKNRDYRVLLMPFLFVYLILWGTYYLFDWLIKDKQTF